MILLSHQSSHPMKQFFCRRSIAIPCCFAAEQRAHYGEPRHKPKVMKTKPKRTPSMLALDNFDFYYGPLFGDKWPSIRLGLLTPNKFAAVINRYSASFESNRDIIKSLGTIDLIEMLTGRNDPPEEIVQTKQELDDQLSQLNYQNQQEHFEFIDPEIQGQEAKSQIEYDPDSRLGSSLNQFLPPTREIKHGKFQSIEKSTHLEEAEKDENEGRSNANRVIYDTKFKITGLESIDSEVLTSVEDIPLYPRDLQALIYPRGCIDSFPGPIRDSKNISSWWLLDGGSVVPVLALDLREDDNVLDMCAAPGGKSLMIAQTNRFATLTCNDNKLHRLGQLRRSLEMFIPAGSELNSRIVVKRKDAASVESWDDIDLYDKVLVDAPCSTDRLSVNEDLGNVFSTDKTHDRLNLPQMQTRMLVNALRAVRVGGSVVYSTCSMAPTQNEMVVENAAALARDHYGIDCVERSLKRMENQLTGTGLYRFSAQQHRGSLVLPYVISNFGPMYVCKLQRIN